MNLRAAIWFYLQRWVSLMPPAPVLRTGRLLPGTGRLLGFTARADFSVPPAPAGAMRAFSSITNARISKNYWVSTRKIMLISLNTRTKKAIIFANHL